MSTTLKGFVQLYYKKYSLSCVVSPFLGLSLGLCKVQDLCYKLVQMWLGLLLGFSLRYTENLGLAFAVVLAECMYVLMV